MAANCLECRRERESHRWITGEEVCHHIWDGSSLYAPMLAPRCLLFKTSFLLRLQQEKKRHTVESLPAFMPSPSHSTLVHITQGRSNAWLWCKWCLCQSVSPIAVRAAVLYVLIHIAPGTPQSALYFICAAAAIPLFFFSPPFRFVARLCRMKSMWGRTSNDQSRPSEVYIKWPIPACEVHIRCLKCSDHANESDGEHKTWV